jgi:hypothetical protein
MEVKHALCTSHRNLLPDRKQLILCSSTAWSQSLPCLFLDRGLYTPPPSLHSPFPGSISQKFGNAFPTARDISLSIVVADIVFARPRPPPVEVEAAGSCRRGTFMAQGRKMKGGMEARESVYHSDHIVFRVSCRPPPSEKGRGLVLRGILIHGSLFVVSLRPARHPCLQHQHRKETKKHGSGVFS